MLPDGRFQINRQNGRAIVEVPCGYACYVETDGPVGHFTGTHVGALGDGVEAMRWMFGDDTVKLLKVWETPVAS